MLSEVLVRGRHGRHGGTTHQSIIDLVRFELVALLRITGWTESMGLADGFTLVTVLCRERFGTRRVPDVILLSGDEDEGDLLVEVGDFEPDKWPDWATVLHVSKDHRVSVISATGARFEQAAVKALRALFAETCEACRALWSSG